MRSGILALYACFGFVYVNEWIFIIILYSLIIQSPFSSTNSCGWQPTLEVGTSHLSWTCKARIARAPASAPRRAKCWGFTPQQAHMTRDNSRASCPAKWRLTKRDGLGHRAPINLMQLRAAPRIERIEVWLPNQPSEPCSMLRLWTPWGMGPVTPSQQVCRP